MKKEEVVRVTISLPKKMCEELDQIAKDNLISRSYLIKIGMQNYLNSLETVEDE